MALRKELEIINDFHLHLGGSLSRKFLEDAAIRNNVYDVFLQLDKAQKDYVKSLGKEHKEGPRDLKPIWKLFFLVSQIIKVPEDIRLGVLDVVENSEAIDLEIRTTPKELDGKSWEPYVEAFVTGLLQADAKFPDRNPRGMLSLDRTIHSLQDAKKIIDYVEKDATGMLVGIDICGNPADQRKLSRKDLAEAITYVLEKNMGLAIHLGEIKKDIEEDDINHILDALKTWQSKQKTTASDINPFHGKVRLGHAIYLTTEQRNRIKDLDLPIEICPSCHEQLNWCTKEEHPITKVYSPEEKEAPLKVLSGTDDSYIFNCGAKSEAKRVAELMKCTPEQSRKNAEQQGIFKFGHFGRLKSDGKKKEYKAAEIILPSLTLN